MAATLAKPKSSLIPRASTYKSVGGDSAAVKTFNGVGKQIAINNQLLSGIATSLQRKASVEQKVTVGLFRNLEQRKEALQRLNKKKDPVKKRAQLQGMSLKKKRGAAVVKKKKQSEDETKEAPKGLGILNGIFGFFKGLVGKLITFFVAGAAFKWLSKPENARRFADAFLNFYNWILKPLGKFLFGWATWIVSSVGSGVGGVGKIIEGFTSGNLGMMMQGFGDVIMGLPGILTIPMLLNPVGTLAFGWKIIKEILGIAPPKDQKPKGKPEPKGKPKPKPKPKPKKPNRLQRFFSGIGDQVKKLPGAVGKGLQDAWKGATKLGNAVSTGASMVGNTFKRGMAEVGKGLKGIKDAAMRKLVEPAMELVKPLMNKLSSAKKKIMDTLLGFLPPKAQQKIAKLGGASSEGMMKKIGGKAIPILGGLVNLFFGVQALKAGDPIGALLEFGSGAFDLIGLIPGGQWGPAVSMIMDVYNFLRDFVGDDLKKKEEALVNSFGLKPIMDALKGFADSNKTEIPDVKAERGLEIPTTGSMRGDPRLKSGNYLVGALDSILNVIPGGELLRSVFETQLVIAKRAFGAGIVNVETESVPSSVPMDAKKAQKGLSEFLDTTVEPIKNVLKSIFDTWLSGILSKIPAPIRDLASGALGLLGLNPGANTPAAAPVFDPSSNYGMKTGEEKVYQASGQTFKAVRTATGFDFFRKDATSGEFVKITEQEAGEGMIDPRVKPASHPQTGDGFTIEGVLDANGRPIVLSKEGANAFARMMKDSGGKVKGSDIASAQRSPSHNNTVGGVANSNHLYGNALDIHGESQQWMRQHGKKYGWIVNDYKGSHGGHFNYRKGQDTGAGGSMLAAAQQGFAASVQPEPGEVAPVGTDATKKGRRIILHWTAGGYNDDRSIKADFGWAGYHRYVLGDGSVVANKHPGHGTFGQSPPYHTYNMNSGNAAFSVSAMAGATPNNFGRYPVKDIQIQGLAKGVAQLAKSWGWKKEDIHVQNVFTHGEIGPGKPVAGADQWGKWDLMKLKVGDKMGSGPEKIRDAIRQRMNVGGLVNYGRFTTGGKAGETPSEHIIQRRMAIAKSMGKKYDPKNYDQERMNVGGVASGVQLGLRAAANPGAPMINNRSVLDPGLGASSAFKFGSVQRVIIPIPTPMSSPQGAGIGGAAAPSPLTTFGR